MSNYHTWVWIDGEDDDAGDSWIQISYPDGEEMATILCRNYETVKAEHPEWIRQKENAANQICEALNFYEAHAEYVTGRGTA